MKVTFSKPATYSGVKTIRVMAMARWDFPTECLTLQREADGWAIIRKAESAIWSNTEHRIIVEAKAAKWFSTGMTLKAAKLAAEQLIQQNLFDK